MFRNKFRTIISLVLILTLLPINVMFAGSDNYNSESNAREWKVTSAKATTGTTFTTLSFKAKITANGKYYEAYIKRMNNPLIKEYDDGENITSYFMSYISTIGMAPEKQNLPNFYSSFYNQAGKTNEDKQNIKDFFSGRKGSSRMILLDSVVVINYNGVAQGEINEIGAPVKGGKVYETREGFIHAAPWGDKTKAQAYKEHNMYDIIVDFPAQPVLDPTAVITRGTSEIPTTYEVFKKGEVIDLVGRKSFFPENVKKEYLWSYKSQNSTTWLDGGTNVTLNVKNLPIGTYDVKLHTQYHMICGWLKEPYLAKSDPDAKAVIKIIKNDEIASNTIVTSPKEMEIGETDTFANVPVNMKSTLEGIDISKVKKVEYILTTAEENIVYSSTLAPTLTVNIDKTFKIPYKGSPFTQGFKGRVIYTLIDGEMRGNNLKDWATSNTYIHKKEPIERNEPPIPILAPIPDVVVGSDIRLNGSSSFDPDGQVVSWNFSIPQWGWGYDEEGKSSVFKTAPTTGTRIQAVLGVTDDEGAYAETEQFFNVTAPPPILNIDVSGTLKENRKVTFHSNVSNIMSYTTSEEQVTWKIKPYDGQDASVIKAKTLTGKNIDTLFKKLGSYYVECTAFNSAGMSSTQSMIIKISEDLKPEVVVSSFDVYYRDSEKKVGMTFFDNSESIDGDYIAERSWYYAFDKDNDGSFSDETLTFLKTATLPDDNKLDMTVDHVGKYRIYLRVKEGFGQETIPEFVSSGDYKINNGEKIVEVDNHNPVVSFYPKTEKKVDVIVVTDYTGDKFNQLGTRLNEYVGESFDDYLNVKLMVNTDSKYVGRFTNEEASGFGSTPEETTQKYKVASWGGGYSWSLGTYGLTEYSDGSYVSFFRGTDYTYNYAPYNFSGTFPARVKQAANIGGLFVVLLENGDLYYTGCSANVTPSTTNGTAAPFKKYLSNIKTMVGNSVDLLYLLSDDGSVYAAGDIKQYKPTSSMFWNGNGELDTTKIFAYYENSASREGYGFQEVIGTGGYNAQFWKMPQLSNISHIQITNAGLIARNTLGDWYGFGSGLSAYGQNTGFGSASSYESVSSLSYSYYNNGWKCTQEIFDYQNSIVKLTNLSNLDKAVGGIASITPSSPAKVYAKNGNTYTYKIETHATYDGNGFNLNDDGVFTYTQTGTWNPNTNRVLYGLPINSDWNIDYVSNQQTYTTPYIKSEISQYNNPINIADYEPNEAVHEYAKTLGLLDTWEGSETVTGYNQYAPSKSTPPPSTVRHYYRVPSTFTYGGISDFSQYSYAVEGTLLSYSVGMTEGRGDNDNSYYWVGKYNYKVVGFKKEPNSSYVAGWKFYATDLSKLPSSTFRPNSEKYILYLGEKDSFQKIPPSIADYIKTNNIKVKVATDPRFVDRVTNKASEINLRDFLTATPNGKLYVADGLETMLADITEENKNFVEGQDGLYVIKGEDNVTYNSYFSDLEDDAKINEVYNHLQNSTYFENGEGQSIYHNVKRNAPVTVFDKVGLYNVFYRASDQPTTETPFQNYNKDSNTDELKVYVHRRPIAQMNIQYCNYAPFSMSVTDKGSYDLDHQSQSARGIQEVEWQYRKGSDKTWQIQRGPLGTSIKIANISKGEKVLVYYRVKDLEGAWSKPVFEEVTPEVRLLMDAALVSEKPENKLTAFPTGNNVIFKDLWSSYPYSHHLEIQMYDGNTPLLSKVLLTKEKGNVKTESPYPERTWKDVLFYIPQMVNGKLLEDKTYTFVVKALDSEDPAITKEKVFIVTTISNRPPTVDFTKLMPSPLYEGDQHEVSLKVDDPDKDILKLDVYLKYDQKPEILYQSFTNLAAGQGVALKPLTVEQGKTIQWRGVVTDPKGEWAESKKVVPIEAFGIDSISVKGAWQHWRGQKNAFGQQMTNEPNRFLSMEKVTFSVNTRGAVNKVSLNLSPELEAMSYKDSKGHVYYYKDEVGYDVKFPLAMKLQSKELYQTTYILPFADSTQNWENKRLKKAYHILVTIENDERKRTIVYGDQADEVKIDITGNIFDLLYNQPTKLKK